MIFNSHVRGELAVEKFDQIYMSGTFNSPALTSHGKFFVFFEFCFFESVTGRWCNALLLTLILAQKNCMF